MPVDLVEGKSMLSLPPLDHGVHDSTSMETLLTSSY